MAEVEESFKRPQEPARVTRECGELNDNEKGGLAKSPPCVRQTDYAFFGFFALAVTFWRLL